MMTKEVLAEALEGMTPVMSEADGIQNFSDAWKEYFLDSEVAGSSCVELSIDAALLALRTAMTGVAGVDAAAGIQAGIVAFWGALSSVAASVWITVPLLASVTPPTTLSGISAAVAVAGTANITGKQNLADSAAAIAAAIHPLNLGGLAVNTAAPPVSLPIT